MGLITRDACRDDALPLSLYTPYANLPEDGRVRTRDSDHNHTVAAQYSVMRLVTQLATFAQARCADVQTQLEGDETCDPMTRSCQVRALLAQGCSCLRRYASR
jgi:hypothetical protein